MVLLGLPAPAERENSPCMGWIWSRGSAPTARLGTGVCNTPLCPLLRGQGSGAASTAAPNEHTNSLEPDLECASWDRCHLAEMSHGRGVTWHKCHLGEVSPGRNVTWESCHLAPLWTVRYNQWGCSSDVCYLLPSSLCLTER